MTWHPIETAPKDGTEVLLWKDRRIVGGSWNSGGAMHMPHWMGGIFDPTHWMPLPAPPQPMPADDRYIASNVVPTYTRQADQTPETTEP
jgi:hypothetical protein